MKLRFPLKHHNLQNNQTTVLADDILTLEEGGQEAPKYVSIQTMSHTVSQSHLKSSFDYLTHFYVKN